MRTFTPHDEATDEIHAERRLGLPTAVWSHLYLRIDEAAGWPILGGLWREHWGPEADARLTATQAGALAAELTELAAALDTDTPTEVTSFVDQLAALCQVAAAEGLTLVVEAD